MLNQQSEIDRNNSTFWEELCGSSLARSIGVTEVTPESLIKFDRAYMEIYPYLPGFVTREDLANRKVLEIGLGYGTLGQFLASQQCEYYGLDIASGPVAMMAGRLRFLGKESEGHVRVGSALEIPFPGENFDFIYSIGCLHHTGNISKSVDEVYRVLRPGGKAIIMLYNSHSFRQLVQVRLMRLVHKLLIGGLKEDTDAKVRALYDANSSGSAAPHTDFVSRSEVRQLFHAFSHVQVEIRNFDDYSLPYGIPLIRRKWLLNNIARVLGLDLYITAVK